MRILLYFLRNSSVFSTHNTYIIMFISQCNEVQIAYDDFRLNTTI